MIFADSSLPKPHVTPAIHTITTAATGANIEWVIFALVAFIVVGLAGLALSRMVCHGRGK